MELKIITALPNVRPALLRIIISLIITIPVYILVLIIGIIVEFINFTKEYHIVFWNEWVVPCFTGKDIK